MPTLVILGDTHELHREVEVPDGDILLFTGDLTMFSKRRQAVTDFNTWLGELPHRYKVCTVGNHEFLAESEPHFHALLSNARVLINESIEIDGLRIFGSPATVHYGGAFGMSSASDRARLWSRIPRNTNILLVHGPPWGILDCAPGSDEHVGDPELRGAIKNLPDLRLVAFGHAHGAYGQLEVDGILHVNAALMGPLGELENKPVILRMSRLRGRG
jgi:predicted phosphohydrolase